MDGGNLGGGNPARRFLSCALPRAAQGRGSIPAPTDGHATRGATPTPVGATPCGRPRHSTGTQDASCALIPAPFGGSRFGLQGEETSIPRPQPFILRPQSFSPALAIFPPVPATFPPVPATFPPVPATFPPVPVTFPPFRREAPQDVPLPPVGGGLGRGARRKAPHLAVVPTQPFSHLTALPAQPRSRPSATRSPRGEGVYLRALRAWMSVASRYGMGGWIAVRQD
jgi:hypothetical protein